MKKKEKIKPGTIVGPFVCVRNGKADEGVEYRVMKPAGYWIYFYGRNSDKGRRAALRRAETWKKENNL
jgi:hypothetical protein